MPADHKKPIRIIAFIFARGGSKGLPGKNLRPLAGKPLLAHSISTANGCERIERVIVSTDCELIAETARHYGAEVPFRRPEELASDSAPEILAWKHAVQWSLENLGEFDVFVSLPTTAPLRSIADVNRCIDCLLSDPSTDIVLTGTPSTRSPYFNMVKTNEDESVSLLIDSPRYTRRQDAPRAYDLTTVAYVARPKFILGAQGILNGRARLVEIPPERALDIDTPLDLLIAEHLMGRAQ